MLDVLPVGEYISRMCKACDLILSTLRRQTVSGKAKDLVVGGSPCQIVCIAHVMQSTKWPQKLYTFTFSQH